MRMEAQPCVNQIDDMDGQKKENFVKLNSEVIKYCGYSSGKLQACNKYDFGIRFFMKKEDGTEIVLPPSDCRKVAQIHENYIVTEGDISLQRKSVAPVVYMLDTDEMKEDIPQDHQVKCLEKLLSIQELPPSFNAAGLPPEYVWGTIHRYLAYERAMALKI